MSARQRIEENRHIRQALAEAVAEYDNIRVIAPAEIMGLTTTPHAAEVFSPLVVRSGRAIMAKNAR